jgi:ABC-type multidrug transport system fused ATPase/permease subunit
MFVAVCLYGAKLLYTDIQRYGCDPTAGMFSDTACDTTGASILGAFLGFLFAAEGMSQVATFLEALVEARVAAFEALQAIKRTPGAPQQILYNDEEQERWKRKRNVGKLSGISDTESESDEEHGHANQLSSGDSEDFEFRGTASGNFDCLNMLFCRKKKDGVKGSDGKVVGRVHGPLLDSNVKSILPFFEINSSDFGAGIRLDEITGKISFRNVNFSYPTRPAELSLRNFSIDIEGGKTIAFVGPR